MDDRNPLRFNPLGSCPPSEINRSGRPTNKNLIKFGPQPTSLVSQMLKKMKDDCGSPAISLNVVNKSQVKCLEIENCGAHSSSSKITLDPDPDLTKIPNTCKDTKNKTYSCDFADCKYVCKLSSNLIKHKRIHTSEKPFLCHLCSFRSNFINSLKVHQRIHTAERPYGCNYCNYQCNSSSNLKKHCKHKHSNISIEGQKPEPLKNTYPKTEPSATD